MRTQIDANWWTAHSLAALMRDNGIYLDDSFQSYHRWVTENNQHYMRSLLNGKAPTSIYLANKGFKTSNIPLVNDNSVPQILKKDPKISCVVGLSTEPERLADIRKNRMNSLKETENKSYTDLEKIKEEVDKAKKLLKNTNGL